MNIKKFLVGTAAGALMLSALVVPAFAKTPGAAVKNENANPNACWGMDRAFYASQGFFPENMDIKQSFLPTNGKVGEQRAAWVATYCDPHGPVVTPPPVCDYNVVPYGEQSAGLYGSVVTTVTITNTDCSTVNALKVEHTQNFSQGQTTGVSAGWAGWSCVQPGYLDAIGGGVIPGTGTIIAQGLAEFGAPAIDTYNYPVYPNYTYNGAGGEEGWVVEAAGPTPPTSTYVLCGPTL